MSAKLEPQVAELLKAVEEAGIPPMHAMTYSEAREFYRLSTGKLAGEPPGGLDVSERLIDTPDPLSVRIYVPREGADTPRPGVIYFHGGGWCIGDLDSHDHVCRWLAAGSGCCIIAVDYRLAPENKFPAAVEDAYAATQWIAGHAAELGIDAGRIAVAGDSAGANLSAVVSILARENGAPAIRCQLLIYPATDMLMQQPSHVSNGEDYRLTRSLICWFINGYLRNGEDMIDYRASPALVEDLHGLPPACVMTAGFDPLVDEGRIYAERLEAQGVAVEYRCYEGMIHGFIAMPGVLDTAQTALGDAADYLRRQLQA